MRRIAPLAVIALTFAALLVIPALAAEHEIVNVNNAWSPPDRTIAAGDRVTWRVVSGFHDLAFEDGKNGYPAAAAPWTSARTFTVAGAYRYSCTIHNGMVGTITVTAPAEPTPGGTATPTADPAPTVTPGPSPAPTTTTSPYALPPATVTPAFTLVRVTAKRRRVAFTLALTTAGRVDATVDRAPLRGRLRYRRLGTLGFAGLSTTPKTFRPLRTREGRRLTPGRYRVRLRIAGGPSAPRTVRFRLR